MTTKTKAADLVSKFFESDKMVFNIEGAKECALIAVDEILDIIRYHGTDIGKHSLLFWQEVKQEIKNL